MFLKALKDEEEMLAMFVSVRIGNEDVISMQENETETT